jgi:hypothetical protein
VEACTESYQYFAHILHRTHEWVLYMPLIIADSNALTRQDRA